MLTPTGSVLQVHQTNRFAYSCAEREVNGEFPLDPMVPYAEPSKNKLARLSHYDGKDARTGNAQRPILIPDRRPSRLLPTVSRSYRSGWPRKWFLRSFEYLHAFTAYQNGRRQVQKERVPGH